MSGRKKYKKNWINHRVSRCFCGRFLDKQNRLMKAIFGYVECTHRK